MACYPAFSVNTSRRPFRAELNRSFKNNLFDPNDGPDTTWNDGKWNRSCHHLTLHLSADRKNLLKSQRTLKVVLGSIKGGLMWVTHAWAVPFGWTFLVLAPDAVLRHFLAALQVVDNLIFCVEALPCSALHCWPTCGSASRVIAPRSPPVLWIKKQAVILDEYLQYWPPIFCLMGTIPNAILSIV